MKQPRSSRARSGRLPLSRGRSSSRARADREQLLAAERRRLELPRHGAWRMAVGAPSPYFVAQSSLAAQWIVELAAQLPDVGVERFTADPGLAGATLESATPLGNVQVVAWTCSFEPDAVEVLQTLAAAGIPLASEERRRGRHPLLVMGGPVAEINPLPLARVLDVICLGPAEVLLPRLMAELATSPDRERLLESLAGKDGFLVPQHHLDARGRPLGHLHRAARRGPARAAEEIPASHCVTPLTEYADRALIEISRGCPEHCRFCWIGHAAGRLTAHPVDLLAERIHQLMPLTSRLGMVATAVGDHPDLGRLLGLCRELGIEVSVSSLRIPALVPEVLEPLYELGARTVTIAPEAGTDALRAAAGKRITDEQILTGVEAAQRAGIEGLKLYFMLGLPGETDDEVRAIAALIRHIREVMVGHGRARGRLRDLRVSVGMLVPKPYTPLHRLPMLEPAEARRRVALLRRELRGLSNLRLETPALRDAWWQGYLSRAGTEALELLQEHAAGAGLASILERHRAQLAEVIWTHHQGEVPWHLVAGARAASHLVASPTCAADPATGLPCPEGHGPPARRDWNPKT